MHKRKSLLIFIGISLLLGLIVLPAEISQADNSGQPAFEAAARILLPAIYKQDNLAPQGNGQTKTPTKKAPTGTQIASTATRGATPGAPTRTATRAAAPTSTKAASTPTRAATTNPPTATAASTRTNVPPTTAPTATGISPTATRVSPTATVPAPPSGSFTFLSWADTKSGTSTLAALSNQVKKLNPAFTFYEGDLQNSGFASSSISSWTNALNGNANNGLFDITFPLRGNHDASNTSGWQSYFDVQSNAARIGATQFTTLSTDLTYAFDYGNSYFIGIDVPGDTSLITSAQITFLDNGLAGAEARGLTHAFIFLHGPIYTVSAHTSCGTRVCATPASVVNLVKVLNKHSIVSAVFNGHEHLQAYVHLDSSRVPEITHPFEEFITGSAGAELHPCDKTYRFDACGSYSGFATITVADRSFTVNIYNQSAASPVKTYNFTKP